MAFVDPFADIICVGIMLAVTCRGLPTIGLVPEIVYGCNYVRARSGYPKRFAPGGMDFLNISGDSKRERARAVGFGRSASLTLLAVYGENLEKRSENSLFLMLYVLLYIC